MHSLFYVGMISDDMLYYSIHLICIAQHIYIHEGEGGIENMILSSHLIIMIIAEGKHYQP